MWLVVDSPRRSAQPYGWVLAGLFTPLSAPPWAAPPTSPTNDEFLFLLWNGEPGVIAAVGNLAETAWPLMAVIVLVAGFVRLRGWRRRNWLRTAAWAGAWVAGIALIVLVAVVGGLGSEAPSVGWGALELPIFATWLALGARVNRILSTPAHSRDVPETSDRSSRQASS